MKAKEAVATESLPTSLREICQYMILVNEIKRAESPKYTTCEAYELGYSFEFGKDPAKINLYLRQRFELNSDLKAAVEMSRPNISLAL